VRSRLNTADSAIAYSINQSAKKALYKITTKKEQYMAKAFIDMFVPFIAKALSVRVLLAAFNRGFPVPKYCAEPCNIYDM
jgi:hypothetical protein